MHQFKSNVAGWDSFLDFLDCECSPNKTLQNRNLGHSWGFSLCLTSNFGFGSLLLSGFVACIDVLNYFVSQKENEQWKIKWVRS